MRRLRRADDESPARLRTKISMLRANDARERNARHIKRERLALHGEDRRRKIANLCEGAGRNDDSVALDRLSAFERHAARVAVLR